MSEHEPVNVTINIADTVPLRLYNELKQELNGCRGANVRLDQIAASLRIEVAALTQALEVEKSRLLYSQKMLNQAEREITQLNKLLKLRDSNA